MAKRAAAHHEPLGPVQPVIDRLLRVKEPMSADPATAEHHRALAADPLAVDHYRALARHYLAAGQRDRAWCTCAALVYLDQADDAERACYQQRPLRAPAITGRVLTEEAWERLRPADQSRHVSAISCAIWESIVAIRALPHKAFGLARKHRFDLAASELPFARIVRETIATLGVAEPELYLQLDQPGWLLLATCSYRGRVTPALVVRHHAIEGCSEAEARFVIGSRFATMRPEYHLARAVPPPELDAVLAAAVTVGGGQHPVPAVHQERVSSYCAELRKRAPFHVLGQLPALVERLLEDPDVIDAQRWRESVETTADRVGLALCGDLGAAARMIAANPGPRSDGLVRDQIHRLVAYSVSDSYAAVRRELGLAGGG